MVPDRQKVRTDGMDDAKTISLQLHQGIKKFYNLGQSTKFYCSKGLIKTLKFNYEVYYDYIRLTLIYNK